MLNKKRAKIKQAEKLLKILAHKERLIILCQLNESELSVSQLLQNSSLSQSAMSQHLAKLRKLNIVRTRKEAQAVFYSLCDEKIVAVIAVLHQLYCGA
jgi:ArsR family transcriptional regulator, virulence genes transcriptional regulator